MRSRRGERPGRLQPEQRGSAGGAERLRTRRTALPAAAGNRYRGRMGAGRAAGGAERNGKVKKGWGQDRRGLRIAHLAFGLSGMKEEPERSVSFAAPSEASSDPESALRTGLLLLESGAAPSRLEGWRDAVFEADNP